MAPEQIDGSKVDRRADIYALGCALYEMISGLKPFVGESALDVLLMQTQETAVPLENVLQDIPLPLSKLVEKCMAKAPRARYQTAAALAKDLDAILGGGKPRIVVEIESVMSRMQAIAASTPRRVPRSRRILTIATGMVLVAVSAVSMSIALPGMKDIQVGQYRVAAAKPRDRAAERDAAQAALANVVVFANAQKHDIKAIQDRFAALFEEHGGVMDEAIGEARNAAIAEFEKLGLEELERVLASSKRMRAEGKPMLAVDALLALDENWRDDAAIKRFMAELIEAFAAVRASEGMAYVTSGRSPIGPDGTLVHTAGFLLDVTEVSNGDYARYVSAKKARPPEHWGGKRPPLSIRQLPVIGVSHAEATNYAAWLGKRLPTAIEWEKAARGDESWRYPWGNDFDPSRCVARGSEATELQPVPSMSSGRSPWSVAHMAGNAAEWTSDPATLADGAAARIVRGGSLRSHPANVTTYAAYPIASDTRDPALLIGFRCARDAR